jgi:hypothetical protein
MLVSTYHSTYVQPKLNSSLITVGLGRPFIYAYSAYGQEGVEKAMQILKVINLFKRLSSSA